MNSKNINTFILSLGYIREVDDQKSEMRSWQKETRITNFKQILVYNIFYYHVSP